MSSRAVLRAILVILREISVHILYISLIVTIVPIVLLEGYFHTIHLSRDLLFYHTLPESSVVNLVVLFITMTILVLMSIFLFNYAKKNLHTRYKNEAYAIIFLDVGIAVLYIWRPVEIFHVEKFCVFDIVGLVLYINFFVFIALMEQLFFRKVVPYDDEK